MCLEDCSDCLSAGDVHCFSDCSAQELQWLFQVGCQLCEGNGYDMSQISVCAGSAPSEPFIAEIAEGSSNNKYIEIFNPTGAAISLDGYYFGSVSNSPATPGQYDHYNPFNTGATVGSGDVYVVCHGSADAAILAECDEPSWTYLSNGDDAYCLLKGDTTTYDAIDCVGDFQGDPGSGWPVCGVAAATQDKTLVRKADADFSAATAAGVGVTNPTQAIWTYTSVTDCQWDIYDQNTWTYLGSHTVTGAGAAVGCVGSVYGGGLSH